MRALVSTTPSLVCSTNGPCGLGLEVRVIQLAMDHDDPRRLPGNRSGGDARYGTNRATGFPAATTIPSPDSTRSTSRDSVLWPDGC